MIWMSECLLDIGRWIGRAGPISWPERSPDMTPLDFYFWGHLKSVVYETTVPSEDGGGGGGGR